MNSFFMKKNTGRAYICSPLNAPTKKEIKKNMREAKKYALIASIITGKRCIATHSFLPLYLNDTIPEERSLALSFGLSWLELCDTLIICGNYVSEGMKGEIKKAKDKGIHITYLKGKPLPSILLNIITAKYGWHFTYYITGTGERKNEYLGSFECSC